MSYRFKVFFYARKNYVDKDGEVRVMVRLVLDGQKAQFSSNLKVSPKIWDSQLNMAVGDSTVARVINEGLREIRMELNFHYKELKQQGVYFTVEKIRDAYLWICNKTLHD